MQIFDSPGQDHLLRAAGYAPLITATMTCIAGIYGFFTIIMSRKKMQSDVTLKLLDWYEQLEEEFEKMHMDGQPNEADMAIWYKRHVRQMLYQYANRQHKLVNQREYEYWMLHTIERCRTDKRSTPTYAEGICQALTDPAFTVRPDFVRHMIKELKGSGEFSKALANAPSLEKFTGPVRTTIWLTITSKLLRNANFRNSLSLQYFESHSHHRDE